MKEGILILIALHASTTAQYDSRMLTTMPIERRGLNLSFMAVIVREVCYNCAELYGGPVCVVCPAGVVHPMNGCKVCFFHHDLLFTSSDSLRTPSRKSEKAQI